MKKISWVVLTFFSSCSCNNISNNKLYLSRTGIKSRRKIIKFFDLLCLDLHRNRYLGHIFMKFHFWKPTWKPHFLFSKSRFFKWVFEKTRFSKSHLKTRFYYIRSGIFKWVFKSGICRKLWPLDLSLKYHQANLLYHI